MSLIDKINKAKNESFEKWFEPWYEKLNLENELIKSAERGFDEYRINIKEESDTESEFGKKKQYLVRRLRDPRTTKSLQTKLGDGFKVEFKEQTREGKLLGLYFYKTSDWISIRWEE